MATERFNDKPGVTTENVRVFHQEGCGQPWQALGCINVTGLQLDPVNPTQVVCVDDKLRRVRTIIDQAADLQALVMTNIANTKITRKALARIDARAKKGCFPNFFFALSDCPDPNQADSPYHFDDGYFAYRARPASGRQIGNDTIKTSDSKSVSQVNFQRSWLPTAIFNFFANEYSMRGTADAASGGTQIDSIAVLDVGTCQGGCVKCGGVGCTKILVHTETTFQFSDESGVAGSWVVVGPGSVLGHASAYDGKLFRVETSNNDIFVTKDGATWTEASTDVAFAAPTNVASFGTNEYVVAGSNGQVWRATGDGGNWVQVKSSNVLDPDWKRICYDSKAERLWFIGANAGATATVLGYSDDKGKTVTVITSPVLASDIYAQIHCMQHTIFAIVDHELYQSVCDANGTVTQFVPKVVVGATGFITGIGQCDEDDCNRIWLTTENAGEAGVWFSIDGGSTWKEEVLPTVFDLTPSPNINPIGCCESVYGTNPLFGFGQDIVQLNGLGD